MQSRNSRLGLKLFAVYLALYAGFVGINTFSTETMDLKPFAGINLAIWYGFALIIAAIVLSLLYGFMCDPAESDPQAAASVTESVSDEAGDQA